MTAHQTVPGSGSLARSVFRRPVSPTEWSYLSAAHLGELLVAQLVVQGTGEIDARALGRAVAEASAVCPGSRLIRRGRTWVDGGLPARIVVVDGSVLDRHTFTGLPELCGPLAEAEGRPGCEVLLITGESSTLVFRASHAVMDGKGKAFWAAEVFRAMRGERLRGAADTLDDYRLLDRVGRTGQRPRIGLHQRSPLGGRAGAASVWRRRTVPGRHPALTAKVGQVVAQAVGGPARIMVPVDLRRHAPDISSTANLALPVFLDVAPAEHPDAVHRRLLSALAARQELAAGPEAALARLPLAASAAVLRTSRAASRLRHRYLASAIVSHVGRVELPEFSTAEFTATTAYALPVHAPLIPFSITALELPDHTELVVSARGAEGVGRHCDELLDRIETGLLTSLPERGTRPVPSRAAGTAERLLAPGPNGLPPLDATVVDLFRAQARQRPDAHAVMSDELQWTYAELDRFSDVVAARLLANGVRRGEVVGVLADRSAPALAALWGILKAGAAFLPMDVRNPEQWVRDVLGEARARFCLTEVSSVAKAEACGCQVLLLDDLLADAADSGEHAELAAAAPGPDDLAYVIYTSGSTGKPKGVQIEHRSLVNFTGWIAPLLRCDEETRAAYSASPGFDMSMMQIFPPLLNGGAVVPVPGELDHLKLRDMLSGRQANTLALTPSHLDLAERLGIRPAGIRALELGGEHLTAAASRRARDSFGPNCLIINAYGPTETTVACTVSIVDGNTSRASAPIGVPGHRTGALVLDEQLREVSDGELGELYVTGVQLARGYLARPDLTAERFIRLPDGRRAYRTGDLALRLPDGQLEYAGRMDAQVKIRGHRVEPGEVEAVLTALPDIAQAAVVARSRDGGATKALCAFVVLAQGVRALDEAAVRAELGHSLPLYLVPSAVRVLPELPQTDSGKTDRNALPNPYGGEAAEPQAPVLPAHAVNPAGEETSTTAVTAGIWARVLHCDVADLNGGSDFHALGGDSLAVLEMLAALGKELLGQGAEQRFLARLDSLSEGLTLDRVAQAVDEARSES